jgi:hypothetical protein
MKLFNFLVGVFFAVTFLACGSESTDQTQTPVTTTTVGTPVATPAQSGSPLNTNGNVKLNPAHGEPGHRCDIAVGAPLDGAPATPAQTQSPLIQTQQPAATPATTTVAQGMNPPHGQPGHRCDIAVGAPLNSAPAAK